MNFLARIKRWFHRRKQTPLTYEVVETPTGREVHLKRNGKTVVAMDLITLDDLFPQVVAETLLQMVNQLSEFEKCRRNSNPSPSTADPQEPRC